MRSRTERRLGIASLVLTTLWAVMVFSPSFGGPGTRRDLPSAVKPDGEGAQAGSVERSLGSQSASEDFSILEMVLDSVSPTSAHRERFASPHEPPGRPPDRPPGRGRKPQPPGRPPDRPPDHSNGRGPLP